MENNDLRNPYQMKRKRSSVINDDTFDVSTTGSCCSNNVCDSVSLSSIDNTIKWNTTGSTVYKTSVTITNKNNNINSNSNNNNNVPNDDSRNRCNPNRSQFHMSDLVVSASDKAGMDGIDRTAIDAIIEKESGNSLYMQQQKKRDERVNERIRRMKKRMSTQQEQPPNWRRNIQRQVDIEMMDCLSLRPIRSCKVVVDMDMFYMACELLTRPDITSTSTPACVGNSSMITTSNYAARRYGVRAAMPGYIGSALVHQLSKGREKLIFCSLNFDLYQEKSRLIRQVLSEYDANLTAYSLDEAYMDLAPYLACSLIHSSWTHTEIKSYLSQTSRSTAPNDNDDVDENNNHPVQETKKSKIDRQAYSPNNMSLEDWYDQLQQYSTTECISRMELILIEMREHVRSVTGGLTCSAGCAPNFLLAKIASDIHKPNGQCIVPSDHESILQFLHPLPIRKISGIGRVTEKILRAFDIVTVQQLYNERATIRFLFDRHPSTSNFLIRASFGCGSNDSISSTDDDDDDGKDTIGNSGGDHSIIQKGISRERTIPSGKSWAEINSKLEDIAYLLSDDMQKKELAANTIYVKVKLHTFDLLSHGRTLPRGMYIHSAKDLIQVATELLHEIRQKELDSKKVRIDPSIIDDDNNNNNNNNNIARQLFSVRLVGIRCTNFKSQQSSNNDTMNHIGGTQKTMDQFLVPAPSHTTKTNNITPMKIFATSIDNVTNSKSTECGNVLPPSNPYETSVVTVARSPKRGEKPLSVNHMQTNRSIGSVSNPITIGNDMTCDGVDNHHPNNNNNDNKVTTSMSVISSTEYICCPICNVRLLHTSNDILNRHIDTCLNGSTVLQIVREVNDEQQVQTQKRRRKNHRCPKIDFFQRK